MVRAERVLVASAAWLVYAGCDEPAPLPRDGDVVVEPDAPPDAIDAAPDGPAVELPPGMPDLQLVGAEMKDTLVVTQDLFQPDDCAVQEACVGGTGIRTLLRFDTVSANRGTADLVIGSPPAAGDSNATFQWSDCHMHHHFADYARYELVDSAGNVVTARKQSFCVQDIRVVQNGAPSRGYNCAFQGLSRGWSDAYTRYTACQWIDVTGLASGAYTLRVLVNPARTLVESNYDNNVFEVPVTL